MSLYFYPRPLRGGRLLPDTMGGLAGHISIHALCEEGDTFDKEPRASWMEFLSTPSARRAT